MLTLGPFENVDALTNACIDHLLRAGFIVTPDGDEWETPEQLRERLVPRMPKSTLSKRLSSADCPNFRAQRGPTGRILKLRANVHLETYLLLP